MRIRIMVVHWHTDLLSIYCVLNIKSYTQQVSIAISPNLFLSFL